MSKPYQHKPYQQTGFTLFEMVVAVGIFALMGAIAYPALTSLVKTSHAVSESNRRISDLQFAVTYFSRDWLQVSKRKILDRYGSEAHNIVIDENVVTFTRNGRGNLQALERSSLQRVSYRLDENKLLREHWVSLDQGIGEEPLSTVLLKDVAGFEVYFLDRDEEKIETWPTVSSTTASLPIVLEFVLEFEDLGKIVRVLEVAEGAL